MNYFKLPHIIIVFHPGSAGNFLANLFNSLINNSFGNILISNSGDSTFLNSDPMLSFGRHSFEDYRFSNDQEKMQYYLDYINSIGIDRQMVLHTHNFSNISLYRQYYPNSKIIYISINSLEEKLISILLQIEKTKFDKLWQHNWEVDTFNKIRSNWNQYWYDQLFEILGQKELAIDFIKNKHKNENKVILFYLTLQYYTEKFNLAPIFKGISNKDYINHHFSYTTLDGKIIRNNDGPVHNLIDSECVELPFNLIYKANTKELIKIMSRFFSSEFDQKQIEFIEHQVENFTIKQNQEIINNPFLFCYNLEREFESFLINHINSIQNFTSFIVSNDYN